MTWLIGLDPTGATSKAYGVRGIPDSVLVGPDGKVVWQGHPAGLNDSIIEKHIKNVRIGPSPRAVKAYAKAQKQLKQGRLGQAHAIFTQVAGMQGAQKMGPQSKAAAAKILGQAKALLQQARKASAAKQYAAAVEAYTELSRKYRGMGQASAAKTALKRLRRNPAVQQALASRKRETRAQTVVDRALKYLAAKKYLSAYQQLLMAAKNYPETKAGKAAGKRAQQLLDNPHVGPKIRSTQSARERKSLLGMARSYARNGLADKAREKLKTLIAKYPDSREAEAAKTLLETLND